MPRTKIIIIIIIIIKTKIFVEPHMPHLPHKSLPHNFLSRSLHISPVALPHSHFSSFCFHQHTHSLPPTLIRSLSLSLSPINHHNHRQNSGRIYQRKSIGNFLASICFQYFKIKALSLRFLYFVSFFPNLSNPSVICDLI
jgi:hypothetical protein